MTDVGRSETEELVGIYLKENERRVGIGVSIMIAHWANHLFCDKEAPWTEERVKEGFAMKDPLHHLWATCGLMKIYAQKALVEKRYFTAEQEQEITDNLIKAAKLLVQKNYDEDIEELVKIAENEMNWIFEIAYQIYR